MSGQLSLMLGIAIFEPAPQRVTRPAGRQPAAPGRSQRPASLPSLAQSVTRHDLADLPALLPVDADWELLSVHALDVRPRGLWHGMLASAARQAIPEQEGFHPGLSPAVPRPWLVHPDVRYLRRGALHFPYLRRGRHDHLLALPHGAFWHMPFLIAADGLIAPFVHVSAHGPGSGITAADLMG